MEACSRGLSSQRSAAPASAAAAAVILRPLVARPPPTRTCTCTRQGQHPRPWAPSWKLHGGHASRLTTRYRGSSNSSSGAGGGGASHDGHDDERLSPEEERFAMGEAVLLYQQASDMARLQVSGEMEASFAASEASPPPAAAAAPPASTDHLVLFWVEQGLTEARAKRLVAQLEADASEGDAPHDASRAGHAALLLSTNHLSAKLGRLQRILPGVDVVALVAGEPPLLTASIEAALCNMIALVEGLPGWDVVQLVTKQPRLLWMDDMRGRIEKVFSKLMSLHPSKDERVIADIVGENPSLLWRIPDYYMSAMLMDDFPIEIQNMMVLSDQGIGFLYKYYRQQRKDAGGWDQHQNPAM